MSSFSSEWAYYWMCGGVLLLALILLSIHWVDQIIIKYHDRKNVLTTEQVQDFRQGVQTTVSEGKKLIHYDNLRYNRGFEIDKENLKTIEWNSHIKTSEFVSVQIAKLKTETSKNLIRTLTVAVKTTKPNCPKHLLLNILREIKLLLYLGVHDHIVTLIGAHTQEIHNGVVYMVTELCSLGSLKEYLKDNCPILERNGDAFWGTFREDATNLDSESHKLPIKCDDMLRWSHEIACGMDYLASKNIIHGNLAARNVLLTRNKTAKISGFGMSCSLLDEDDLNISSEVNRDPGCDDIPLEDLQYKRWMALETVKRGLFSKKSDVWSYGVTLWEIFSFGETPYAGPEWLPNYSQKLAKGCRLERPSLANTDMYNLMFVCWAKRPKDRPKFTNLKYVTALLLEIFRKKINPTHVPTHLMKLIYESDANSLIEYSDELYKNLF